jgi:RNA polymerase sigma-70 factor (ECF subfamily)
MNPDDATRLLDAWRGGEVGAADGLFTLLYDDLRVLARRQLARLNPGHTLAATILVHESYMKFVERSAPEALNRQHFLGIAARAMRHIVIDHVRRRSAQKRDGGQRQSLDTDVAVVKANSGVDLIAMDDALTRLEALDPRQAKVVELRFFGGFELSEIAATLDISERTAKRDWQKARAFLHAALQ